MYIQRRHWLDYCQRCKESVIPYDYTTGRSGS
jgi:hypothetical protein